MTGTGALRDVIALALFSMSEKKYGNGTVWCYDPTQWNREADVVLAAIAEAGLAPAGGTLTATPDVRAAVERMVDGIDTGDDRNIVRRWLGG